MTAIRLPTGKPFVTRKIMAYIYAISFLNAVLNVVCSFGLNLTQAQQGAILAAINGGVLFIAAVRGRNVPMKVTP